MIDGERRLKGVRQLFIAAVHLVRKIPRRALVEQDVLLEYMREHGADAPECVDARGTTAR